MWYDEMTIVSLSLRCEADNETLNADSLDQARARCTFSALLPRRRDGGKRSQQVDRRQGVTSSCVKTSGLPLGGRRYHHQVCYMLLRERMKAMPHRERVEGHVPVRLYL